MEATTHIKLPLLEQQLGSLMPENFDQVLDTLQNHFGWPLHANVQSCLHDWRLATLITAAADSTALELLLPTQPAQVQPTRASVSPADQLTAGLASVL